MRKVAFVSELLSMDSLVEIEPIDFYRSIFPEGELDIRGAFTEGKFTGIACEITGEKKENGSTKIRRYSITNDLQEIEELLESENFVILSPISYIGKSRKTDSARVMYAFAIEIDGIRVNENGEAVGLNDMFYQMENGILPYPNYIVASGNGLHLYYLFEKPLVLYKNVKKSLVKFKHEFTKLLWNQYITNLSAEKDIQYESAFQGFRLAGGVAKNGLRTRVFQVTDSPISIERLNTYVSSDAKIDIAYKSELTIAEAKEKYPEWYNERIIEKKTKGSWTCHRALYDWWLKRISTEAVVGHRYYCLMCLSIYAIKSDIEYDELETDAFSLLDRFDLLSVKPDNKFTAQDVIDALQIYQDKGYVTYPINSIIKTSGLNIEKNVRHFRPQKIHMKRMSALRDVDYPDGSWRNINGRPTKKEEVLAWRAQHKDGRKIDCIRDTGISNKTVYKWWDSDFE